MSQQRQQSQRQQPRGPRGPGGRFGTGEKAKDFKGTRRYVELVE